MSWSAWRLRLASKRKPTLRCSAAEESKLTILRGCLSTRRSRSSGLRSATGDPSAGKARKRSTRGGVAVAWADDEAHDASCRRDPSKNSEADKTMRRSGIEELN